MFIGSEDDVYANDPQNIKMIKVGYLLDKDPSLLEPLKNVTRWRISVWKHYPI
jgi:hypothetical protein